MSLLTAQAILSHHEDLMEWDQPFPLEQNHTRLMTHVINHLSIPNFATPNKRPTTYCFDPEIYKGKDSLELTHYRNPPALFTQLLKRKKYLHNCILFSMFYFKIYPILYYIFYIVPKMR